jgi:hypothetical protein
MSRKKNILTCDMQIHTFDLAYQAYMRIEAVIACACMCQRRGHFFYCLHYFLETAFANLGYKEQKGGKGEKGEKGELYK